MSETRIGGYTKRNALLLESKLQEVKDNQGILGSVFNGVKEITGFGTSEKDCETMLEKYENGKVSFDEAVKYINSFESKQENGVELVKNIATGVAAIAVATSTVATGGIGWLAAAKAGAPIGAAVKTALGVVDRATNDVDDDALDAKEITKDAVSGAITGTTSAVSSGVGKGIKTGSLSTSVANGTKCGLASGAISGSSSYIMDVALDENKDFNFGDLTRATATSALVSGAVGAGVGAGMYGNASIHGNIGKTVEKSTNRIILEDSATSTLRKVLGKGVKDTVSNAA